MVDHNFYAKILARGWLKFSYNKISCGVPEGRVISPLLFLIYINDITKASWFHTTLFADDFNVHTVHQTLLLILFRQRLILNCVKLTTG